MKVSVLVPVVPWTPSDALPFAALVKHSPAERLWQGQSFVLDAYQTFAFAASRGLAVPMGSGVSLAPLKHPIEAAVQINSLVALTRQSLVAGFGPGAEIFQSRVVGRPYRSPLTAMREYLDVLRALLAGEDVEHDGEYFTAHAQLPRFTEGAVELGLGVLRPRMAALAGQVADVAITWMSPPGYVEDQVVPALASSSGAAGRPSPRVVAVVPVAREGGGRDFRQLLWQGSQVHLSAPHYRDVLRRAGVDLETADRAELTDRLLRADVFLGGSTDQVLDGLARYEAAGVDELVLNTTGVAMTGAQAAIDDLADLLTSLPVRVAA